MKIGMELDDTLHTKITDLAKKERRSFRAQLEMIIESYFKNEADQKAFNECKPSTPTEKTQ